MKASTCLPLAVAEELDALQRAHRRKQEAFKVERGASKMEEMITAVLDLGRWPLLRRPPRHSKHEAEHHLARLVRSAIRSGPLSKADSALLDEMHWVYRRQQEAKQLDKHQRLLLTRREHAHRQASAQRPDSGCCLRHWGRAQKGAHAMTSIAGRLFGR